MSVLRFDQIIHRASPTDYFSFNRARGQIAYAGSNDPLLPRVFVRDWLHLSSRCKEFRMKREAQSRCFPLACQRMRSFSGRITIGPFILDRGGSTSYELIIPYWLLVGISAALAAAPLKRWRFSMRTLLVATSIVAIVLGLLMWLSG